MRLPCWMHYFWITSVILLQLRGTDKGVNAVPLISTPINSTQPAIPISEEYSPSESPSPTVIIQYATKPPSPSPVPTEPSTTTTTTSTTPPSTTITVIIPSISSTTTSEPITTTPSMNSSVPVQVAANQTTVQLNTTLIIPTVQSNATNTTITNASKSIEEETTTVETSTTVKALSLETAVVKRDDIDSPKARQADSNGGGLDSAGIAGICFGSLVIVALAGAISFVLYRRRYLNKPQTLNDKCSNPDSSGYIDDSTIRENSEEMYSLDNDSFLNSLEAMTIQNYWTDTVKHTKL